MCHGVVAFSASHTTLCQFNVTSVASKRHEVSCFWCFATTLFWLLLANKTQKSFYENGKEIKIVIILFLLKSSISFHISQELGNPFSLESLQNFTVFFKFLSWCISSTKKNTKEETTRQKKLLKTFLFNKVSVSCHCSQLFCRKLFYAKFLCSLNRKNLKVTSE